MAINITLTEIFKFSGYRPVPLPESTESAALSTAQARALIDRFAAEDAALFNFLRHYEAPSDKTGPSLSHGKVRSLFNLYQDKPFPKFDVEISKGVWLAFNADEVSGLQRMTQFLKLTKLALACREVLQEVSSPARSDIIDVLKKVSKQIDAYGARYWKISAAESQLIKNIILPVNPVDPELADQSRLIYLYADRFHAKTGLSPLEKKQVQDDNAKFKVHKTRLRYYK